MLKLWNRVIRSVAFKLSNHATTKTEAVLKILKQNGNEVNEDENFYFIKNDIFDYQLRKRGSDIEVYRQVIFGKEYEPLINFLDINKANPKLIVDCGANIGLTAMQFGYYFPNATICAIEPDEANFKQLNENTKLFANVMTYQTAIWSKSEKLKIDRDFRDGQDWSIRTVKETPNAYQEIQAITINDLLEKINFTEIDLLKIDIEGAESELFKDESTANFLNKTNCIAIEIHDECVDRSNIYTILKKAGFTLFNTGELTVGIKCKTAYQ